MHLYVVFEFQCSSLAVGLVMIWLALVNNHVEEVHMLSHCFL